MWEEVTNLAVWEMVAQFLPSASAVKGFLAGSFFTGLVGKLFERHLKKKDEKASGQRKLLTKELESINAQILPVWRSASNYYSAPSQDGGALAQKVKSDLRQIALQWTAIKASLKIYAPKVTLDNDLLKNFRQALTYGLDVKRDSPLPLDDPRHSNMEESAQELIKALTQACIKLA